MHFGRYSYAVQGMGKGRFGVEPSAKTCNCTTLCHSFIWTPDAPDQPNTRGPLATTQGGRWIPQRLTCTRWGVGYYNNNTKKEQLCLLPVAFVFVSTPSCDYVCICYGAVLPRRRPHHVLILSVCLSVCLVPPPRGKTQRVLGTQAPRGPISRSRGQRSRSQDTVVVLT